MSYTLPPLFKQTEKGMEFHDFLRDCDESFHDHGIMGKPEFELRESFWKDFDEEESSELLDSWLDTKWLFFFKNGWTPNKELEEKLYARGAVPKL